MNNEKYIGLDVHQATISVAVTDSMGKLIMESILETKAATILEFVAGLRGTLSERQEGRPFEPSYAGGARLSDDAVRQFHSQLDSGAYDNIVGESDEAFQNSDSHEELLKFLAGVHSKLGTSRGFTRTNILVNANTNGTFIRVSYTSTFEQGNAVEVFTWRKVGGGLKLMGYHVESKTFFTH